MQPPIPSTPPPLTTAHITHPFDHPGYTPFRPLGGVGDTIGRYSRGEMWTWGEQVGVWGGENIEQVALERRRSGEVEKWKSGKVEKWKMKS